MARKEHDTDIFIFNLIDNKVRKETVERSFEYGNMTLSGWRIGTNDKEPNHKYE